MTVCINYEPNLYTTVDVQDKIKQQLLSYVRDHAFKIGQTVSGNTLASAFDNFPYINLLSVKIKVNEEDSYTDYVTTSIQEVAALDADHIVTQEISNV